MNIKHLMEVLNKYNGQKKELGVMDCHTFIFEVYEQDALKLMQGKYKTVLGGIRAGQKYLGDKTLYDVLMNTMEYELIENPKMIQTGDIIINKEFIYDIYLCIEYGKAFGVLPNEHFGVCNTVALTNHYILRHK